MTRSRFPFAGRGDAVAFLIDPGLLGPEEATRRVVREWVAGSRLLEYGDRWLLAAPAAVNVRAETAPGLPVLERNGRLHVIDAGREVDVSPTDLNPVDLLTVMDLDGFRVQHLRSVAGAAPPAPPKRPVAEPTRPAPPLRQRAGVGASDTALARRAAHLAAEAGQTNRSPTRSTHPSPRQGRGTLARLIARSPAGVVVGRRHARYVDRLTRSFDKGDWDDALRGAISLGGSQGALTLRLPRRRTGSLRPGPAKGGAGGSVPFGPTIHEHLRQTYTRAAQQLAQDGQHLLAAFVYADLLGQAGAAVDLLERQAMFLEAAELAESRELDPSYAVRLWWRAGDRERAVRVAAARGAFVTALARLVKDDSEAALELRRAWIDERRDAGDHLGAVTAAWPEPALRDEVMRDIAAAVAQGGAAAGQGLAHWLEHQPTEQATELGRRILASQPEPDLESARGPFLDALSTHPIPRAAWDRELSSLALGALLRGDTVISGAFHDLAARLQRRADPVLVADLPRLRPPVWTLDEPFEIDLTVPGSLIIHDAVALTPNSVLVALGELGVRLLTRDGRVKAQWEVPTHRLVVADHGNRVLLVTDRRPRYSVHQLDLPSGRPQPLPPVDVMPLPTYDGSRAVLVSSRGIEWVEHAADRWRLTWRELTDPGQVVYQVQRTPNDMAALFTDGQINLWHWSMPSMTLRTRSVVDHAAEMAIVATGEAARMEQSSGVATLDWHAPHGHRLTTETTFPTGAQHLLVSGPSFAVTDVTETGTSMAVHENRAAPVSAHVHVPPETDILFRSWGALIVAGHAHGRLVVLDTARRQVVSNLTLRQ